MNACLTPEAERYYTRQVQILAAMHIIGKAQNYNVESTEHHKQPESRQVRRAKERAEAKRLKRGEIVFIRQR